MKAKPNSPDGTELVHIKKQVLWPFPEFRNRSDAGLALTEFLNPKPGPNSIVFALPRGGVPVGEPLSARLRVPLELALVRKLPVPTSPEMGFGAVAIDGSRILNEDMLKYMRISESQIKSITDEVLIEVRRRAIEYTDHELAPSVKAWMYTSSMMVLRPDIRLLRRPRCSGIRIRDLWCLQCLSLRVVP